MEPQNYFPIRIGTLQGENIIPFDIFLTVAGKYIHYLNKNDALDGDRFKSLAAKGVKKVFIDALDEPTYLSYLDRALESNLKKSDVAIAEKAKLAADTFVTVAENAAKAVQTETGYNQTRDRVKSISDFLLSEKGALRGVLSSTGLSQDESQHASNVSFIALRLAEKLGVKDEALLTDLGTAALVHDIGKTKGGTQENHAQVGCDFLKSQPFIKDRILNAVLKHELRGADLINEAIEVKALSLANFYDRKSRDLKIAPLELMRTFFDQYGEEYELDHLMALNDLILARE